MMSIIYFFKQRSQDLQLLRWTPAQGRGDNFVCVARPGWKATELMTLTIPRLSPSGLTEGAWLKSDSMLNDVAAAIDHAALLQSKIPSLQPAPPKGRGSATISARLRAFPDFTRSPNSLVQRGDALNSLAPLAGRGSA